ncbi:MULTISPECIES: patatin-like phospholipase family protein [Chryseobacterium]|uniref:patatin-like phospholipase family protein n=1 Tax=Chryseobacterium sp. R2A-55 TaxID=2744445 RepID=UPI001F4488C2|nr:patatin-like phospholipase family protein [Chryseobacterium sp. R2A-55]
MNIYDFSEILYYIGEDDEGKELISKLNGVKAQNKAFSDVYTQAEDDSRFQFAELVQEGGGTLGISLVGFCFVLEFLGIRFLRLAGTSAGAINTLFMAALGKNKEYPATPELFQIVKNMDMFSFVDGHWIAKRAVRSIISKDGWLQKTIIIFVVVVLFLMIFFPIFFIFNLIHSATYWIALAILVFFVAINVYMYLRFKKANYGVNSGNKFLEFLIQNLQKKGISRKLQLDRIAKFVINEDGTVEGNSNYQFLARREHLDENQNIMDALNNQYHTNLQSNFTLKNLTADYTFISVDISSERKVEFPAQAGLYWSNPNFDVNPAVFVRASMAIPLFFEPVIQKIDRSDLQIVESWERIFVHQNEIPNKGIFVDGGSISNFPISIFHNQRIIIPRVPIFGIRINDSKPNPETEIKNLANYAGRILNTMKSNYDKDFLTKNNFYEKFSIADIDTYLTNANWLDFNMDEKTKRALFLKGVESAIKFMDEFDWFDYKMNRAKVYFENNT